MGELRLMSFIFENFFFKLKCKIELLVFFYFFKYMVFKLVINNEIFMVI